MKKIALLFIVLFAAKINFAQSVAATRSANFGLGQNISNWLERGFDSDWPRPDVYTKADLQKMKDAGIKSLRLPACFERITDTIAPYYVDTNHVLFSYIDSVISWADELNMNVTIDNHHLWDSITNTAWRTQEQRFTHMWAVVANRYAYLDPERYTFELWNEPNLLFARDSLRILFSEAIDSIRQSAPNHTIIVSPNLGSEGFAYSSAYLPFADTNLIYTWHCYDPLDFTHQGFTWESPYFPVGTTFPTNSSSVFTQFFPLSLSSVQDWIAANNKPLILGEFGVGHYADDTSRCNWITEIGRFIDSNHIPAFYWDWQYDFSMFKSNVISQDSIIPCFGEALHYYGMQSSGIAKIDENKISIYPNPIASGETELQIKGIRNFDFRVFDNTGRLAAKGTKQNETVRLNLNAGLYLIQVSASNGIATKKLVVE